MKRIVLFLLSLSLIMSCSNQEKKFIHKKKKDIKEFQKYIIKELDINRLVYFKEYQYEYSPTQAYSLKEPANGSKMSVKVPQIMLINDEVQMFNNDMLILYNEYVSSAFYEKDIESENKLLLSARTADCKVYLMGDILSIVLYKSSIVWQSSYGDINVDTYNYSISKKKFVSNKELFDLIGLNVDEVELELSKVLTENYIKNTTLYGEKISEYNPAYEDCIYYDISDESKIYLNDGLHFIIKGYSGLNKKNYDVKVKEVLL